VVPAQTLARLLDSTPGCLVLLGVLPSVRERGPAAMVGEFSDPTPTAPGLMAARHRGDLTHVESSDTTQNSRENYQGLGPDPETHPWAETSIQRKTAFTVHPPAQISHAANP
jgi:hypothetical protein